MSESVTSHGAHRLTTSHPVMNTQLRSTRMYSLLFSQLLVGTYQDRLFFLSHDKLAGSCMYVIAAQGFPL